MVYGAPSREYQIHLQYKRPTDVCSICHIHKHNHAHNCMHMQVTFPPTPYPNTHASTHTTNACIVLTAVTVKQWNEQKSKLKISELKWCTQLCFSFARSTSCDHAWISVFHVDQIQMLQHEHFMSWYRLWSFSWKKIVATVQVLHQEKGSPFSAQVFVGRIALI